MNTDKLVHPDDYIIGRNHALYGECAHYPHNANYMRGYERGEMVRDSEAACYDGDIIRQEI